MSVGRSCYETEISQRLSAATSLKASVWPVPLSERKTVDKIRPDLPRPARSLRSPRGRRFAADSVEHLQGERAREGGVAFAWWLVGVPGHGAVGLSLSE